MQGLGLQFDPASIAKLKVDYDKIIKDLENKKISLNFNDINKSINELTNKIREIQGVNLSKNILPVTLKEQVQNIKEAVNAYSNIGKTNVTNRIFDNKELKSFTVELERAKGIIDKIQYSISKDDAGNFLGYNVSPIIKEVDNSAKVAEQLAKAEQKAQQEEQQLADAIGKAREQIELKNKAEEKNLNLKQAQASNKALEQEIKDRQKIQDAIAKTVQEREKENRSIEQSQANTSNKALEDNYNQIIKFQEKYNSILSSLQSNFWNNDDIQNIDSFRNELQALSPTSQTVEQDINNLKTKIDTFGDSLKKVRDLNLLGKDITPSGFNFDLKGSTYQDMEKLAKSIGGVNAEIKKIDVQPLQKNGDMVREVTYRVKDGKDKWHEYKVAVVQAGADGTTSLRQLDMGTKDVINRQVGLLSRLKNAWIKFSPLI